MAKVHYKITFKQNLTCRFHLSELIQKTQFAMTSVEDKFDAKTGFDYISLEGVQGAKNLPTCLKKPVFDPCII